MKRSIAAWFIIGLLLVAGLPVARAQQPPPVVVEMQFEETTYYLRDVHFVSAETGWAVGFPHWDQALKGYTGTIIHTTDGGQTWTPQTAHTLVELRGVFFVDEFTGWVVGRQGVILHTGDGGNTWTTQVVDTDDDIRGVYFTDARNGWITSFHLTDYDDFLERELDWAGSIWHTTDGGITWQRQSLPDDASLMNRIDFVDATTGWAVGTKRVPGQFEPKHHGVVYHTTDGVTWTELFNASDEIAFTGVDFVDAQHGWVVGFPTNSSLQGGFVFYTADGGQTWQRGEPGGFFDPLWDVHFVDTQRGYVVGFDYVSAWGPPVWRTLDGGATWEKLQMETHDNDGLYGVSVIGDRVVMVGDHDFVCTTDDAWGPAPEPYGGSSLFQQRYINVHYRLEDVFFQDAQTGWAVGRRSYLPNVWGQVILHTTDGGQTWTTQYEHAPPEGFGMTFSVHRLSGITFTDPLDGWAVGRAEAYLGDTGWHVEGALLHTTDGGQTWEDLSHPLAEGLDLEFFDVKVLPDGTVWMVTPRHGASQNIVLMRGSNGDWQWIDTGVEGNLGIGFALVQAELHFPDAQHGWAIGGLGSIAATTDGGQTWQPQALTCDYPPCRLRTFSAAFIDAQTGWIAGEDLFRTTDGGANWLPQPVEMTSDAQTIVFVDEQTGWLAGDGGLVMVTVDGGDTWTPVENDNGSTLLGAAFVSPQTGWLVGDFGTILHVHGR
jgi:photosystem II stability/assembly factor-like uncharacterized protein